MTILTKIKNRPWIRWFKKKQTEIEHIEVECHNCNTPFKGNYCPECGQSIKEFDRPFSFIIYDFLGNFFAFDTRFFRTFFYLLIKPGFLTSEFFAGRRARYAPPFRIFIFASFILFLLLQSYTSSNLKNVMNKEFTLSDSVKFESKNLIAWDAGNDSTDKNATAEVVVPLVGKKNQTLQKTLDEAASKLEEDIKNSDDPGKNKDLLVALKQMQNPELLTSQFFKYLSWAFFLLLPVFALLFKLFFIRHKINYIRHFFFSVHVHSFIFVIFIIIISTILIFKGINPFVLKTLLIIIPLYLLVSMLKVYKQNFFKTFLKFFMVSFIYTMILVSAIALVMLKTLFLLKT